ncbi:DMT family transporter [Dasania marina]|uniref:DMT family transporter n=1 Tax=Dasania marina TaxID=471499 RepID=UPI0030DA193A
MNVFTWMLGAVLSFCFMAIGARELSGDLATAQILFFRSTIGLLVIASLILRLGKPQYFKTQLLKRHCLRNGFQFLGQYGWFLSIGLLPLAEVFALEFTVPFWVLIIAAVFLKEQLTFRKMLAVALGLLGVVIIVQPGVALVDSASLIMLGAAVGYAVAHVTTKSLTQTEHPLTIMFYMCLLQWPIGLALSLPQWLWPHGQQILWILIVGLTALTANYCLARAMLCAEVGTVVTIDFLRLPAIAIVGVVFYDEGFELALLIGGSIMLLGNLLNAKGLRLRRWKKSSVKK